MDNRRFSKDLEVGSQGATTPPATKNIVEIRGTNHERFEGIEGFAAIGRHMSLGARKSSSGRSFRREDGSDGFRANVEGEGTDKKNHRYSRIAFLARKGDELRTDRPVFLQGCSDRKLGMLFTEGFAMRP